MQDDLFGAPPAAAHTPAPAPVKSPARQSLARVNAAPPDEALLAMARALPDRVRLGTSSWAYPGWAGLVWDTEYPESLLSREGLRAYGEHPLLVCRRNLNPLHGAYGYEDAQREYGPYDRIQDIDHETRELLVRTVKGIAGAGQNVLVTISNRAEGCAPLSVRVLAQGLAGTGPGPQRSATP